MIKRQMSGWLGRMAKEYAVLSIMGPRQSGKTTLARSVFPKHGYVNLEGCVFRRTASKPVRFIADYLSHLWCEGMGATNLVVSNCLFEDTCVVNDPDDPCISAVCVTPTDWDVGPVDKGFVGGGLLVEGCRFVNPGGYVLDLSCGRDVIYRNNVVELGPRAKDNPAQAGKLNVSAAENVLVSE